MAINTVKHDAHDPAKHYLPMNPEKYKGTYPIVCRSSWERAFCMMADSNINIVQWSSEPERIPYSDPITGKQKIYIPDFLITCKQQNGTLQTLLIEIKPSHEAKPELALTDRDKLSLMRNLAKWAAAEWWCRRRGVKFKFMTEVDLFGPNYAAPKKKRVAKPKVAKTPKPKAKPRKKK